MNGFVLTTIDWVWQISAYLSGSVPSIIGQLLIAAPTLAVMVFLAYLVLWCWLFRSLFFTTVVILYQVRLGDQYFESRQQGEHCHYLVSKQFRARWKGFWPFVYVLKYLLSLQAMSLGNSVLHFQHGTLSMDFRGFLPTFRLGANVAFYLNDADRRA